MDSVVAVEEVVIAAEAVVIAEEAVASARVRRIIVVHQVLFCDSSSFYLYISIH